VHERTKIVTAEYLTCAQTCIRIVRIHKLTAYNRIFKPIYENVWLANTYGILIVPFHIKSENNYTTCIVMRYVCNKLKI